MNVTNRSYQEPIQRPTIPHRPKHLSEGKALQDVDGSGKYDLLELSESDLVNIKLLNVPNKITVTNPPPDLAVKTFIYRCEQEEATLKKANSMNLSSSDRVKFMNEDRVRWVEDLRQNKPKMFVELLKMCKETIQNGRPDYVGLPYNFTMSDYYSYMNEPFSANA